jgi:hypothetical protein
MIHTKNSLESGYHEMDRFFGLALQYPYRKVQSVDPADYIRYPLISGRDILAGYLAHKVRVLGEAAISPEPMNDRTNRRIQVLLELPQAVGRKAIYALAESEHRKANIDGSTSAATIIKLTRKLMAELHIDDGFDELVDNNALYDKILDEAIAGRLDKKTYEDEVMRLRSKAPQAMNWIFRAQRTILPRLESPVGSSK